MSKLATIIADTQSLDALRLRGLAYDALKHANLDPQQALDKFFTSVRSDRALLLELIGHVAARSLALAYLDAAAADMGGEDAQALAERLRRTRSSPPGTVSDDVDDAHESVDRPLYGRSSVSSESSPSDTTNSDGGDAQMTPERQSGSRSSPSEAKPIIPTTKRGKAHLKIVKAAASKSVFDSLLLRDGRAIGDLQWSAIDRYVTTNAYENALLKQVKDYAVPSHPNARIRDVVPLAEFQRMAQRAAEHAGEEVAS